MSPTRDKAQIHPGAEVEQGAEIGAGSRIWANAHIRADAVVGNECIVGEGALIDIGVAIGSRCKIQAHALIYRGSVLADEVFVGPAACLTNDRFPRAATPEGAARGDADWELDGVTVERGASLGAHSVVVAGCRVGAWAMVGSGAVVTDDVPPHALVVGNPGRQIGWVCACGRRLETGDSGGSCGSCGRRYVHRSPGLEQVST